jgi:hypothetical protein
MSESSCVAAQLVASQEGLSLMKLVRLLYKLRGPYGCAYYNNQVYQDVICILVLAIIY